MVNTPLPKDLDEEVKKAAKILRSFTMDSIDSGGVDKIIPPTLIMGCKGLAIMTVFKAGFLVSARAGSGLVVAHLSNGSWSAPSAIATAGIGGGFEIGAELTDFVFILNSHSAVEAFSRGGNVTLGGNLSVAVGPLGRNVEGDVSVRSPATIYTYSKTKGLFAGISLEGSGIIERKDANKKMYGREIRAKELLSGNVQPPPEAEPLYAALRAHCEGHVTKLAEVGLKKAASSGNFERSSSSGSFFKRSPEKAAGGGGGGGGGGGSAAAMSFSQQQYAMAEKSRPSSSRSSSVRAGSSSGGAGKSYSSSSARSRSSYGGASSRRSSSSSSAKHSSAVDEFAAAWDEKIIVRAKWPYHSDRFSDLSFRRGDEFVVLTRTETQDDWWEGQHGGKTGIFPANYVVVL